MDGTKTAARDAPEWQVRMPPTQDASSSGPGPERVWARMVSCATALEAKVSGFAKKVVWRIGADDRRKPAHGVEVATALGTKTAARDAPAWQATMPPAEDAPSSSSAERAWARLVSRSTALEAKVSGFAKKVVWRIGADDRRKPAHGVEVATALGTKTAARDAPAWQATMPPAEDAPSSSSAERAWARLVSRSTALEAKVSGFAKKVVWRIGADDRRKPAHGVEVATALGTKTAARDAPAWQATMPPAEDAPSSSSAERAWARLVSRSTALEAKVSGFAKQVWKIGADDPRKPAYGVKVATALTLVSLLYYVRPLYDGVGGTAVWAIMTVVLVFEYTVGGVMYKVLNRLAGTTSGAVLALGTHWIASKSGERLEPFVTGGSVIMLAAAATFSRFIPTVKARFDYGVTVFVMTYSFVAVSGYRVGDLAALVLDRIVTIAIGIIICLAVCGLICPVWAGQELHLLTARNMEKLASSVEACVEDCFADPAAKRAEAAAAAKSEGYKSVLGAKASEDSQANLARWEPPHGRFGFRHPYHQYTEVGAAMRQCAYCVEALSGCAGASSRRERAPVLIADACAKVGARCARVLKEASTCVATMTTSRRLAFAVASLNTAVQELQSDLRALPSSPAEETAETSLAEDMQLFTVALLLIEIAARIEPVVHAVGTLATLARFKPADDVDGADKLEAEMERLDGADARLDRINRL
ncbi:aluminum-activated malate transporter 10-like [Oryza brachyantha]|uniref:aluminum-activated malate transporter 10-like n=1 Tax=Oryza brachyantha TaxID=4533 RepID=UPI001ADB446B|nr:aluminum-activated malate transporter 10-like [Oryza brachyantha]